MIQTSVKLSIAKKNPFQIKSFNHLQPDNNNPTSSTILTTRQPDTLDISTTSFFNRAIFQWHKNLFTSQSQESLDEGTTKRFPESI